MPHSDITFQALDKKGANVFFLLPFVDNKPIAEERERTNLSWSVKANGENAHSVFISQRGALLLFRA